MLESETIGQIHSLFHPAFFFSLVNNNGRYPHFDQIERFNSPSKLASYTGLVPSTYASGGKIFHGKLIPMSNKWLRWALVEAAWASIRTSPYCRVYFENHKRHKGPHTAAIALARRLCEIIWHVLKENRVYEERPFQKQQRTSITATSPAALALS
jgi:hypothetical protein